MITFAFSNDKGVKIHYKTDILFAKVPDTVDDVLDYIYDNFNVYDILDMSWKFRKVYDLKTRNNISRKSRELNMIVYVGEDSKYYQLTSNPRADYTENTDWTEYMEGKEFEASIPDRPHFKLIEYSVKGFEKFAKDWEYNLDMYTKDKVINLYTV